MKGCQTYSTMVTVMCNGRSVDYRSSFYSLIQEARALQGVGSKLADKIWEIAQSGELRKLHEFQSSEQVRVLKLFTDVWGAGATTANAWYQQVGCYYTSFFPLSKYIWYDCAQMKVWIEILSVHPFPFSPGFSFSHPFCFCFFVSVFLSLLPLLSLSQYVFSMFVSYPSGFSFSFHSFPFSFPAFRQLFTCSVCCRSEYLCMKIELVKVEFLGHMLGNGHISFM